VNNYSVESWTRRNQPSQSIYLRRGPDESFDCQLPAEARIELEEIPPPQVYRVRDQPLPRIWPQRIPETEEEIQQAIAWLKAQGFLQEPISPAPPPQALIRPAPVSPPAKPAQSARSGKGIWLLLGFLIVVGLLPHAISTLRTSSGRPVDDTQPQSRPVEVRRALPPPMEVRRALPAVPRALLVSRSRFSENAPTPVPYAQWHQVTLLDGRTTIPACYQGELPSSAALPHQGRFIGEEWSTGNTSWIWMTPAGVNFPSWVDP
jgi:hypothetical protein